MAKGKNDNYVYSQNSSGLKSTYVGLYDFLNGLPLVRRLTRLMAKRYELMYPRDRKESACLTIKLMLKISAMSVITLCMVFGLNPSLYTFLTAVLVIYMLSCEFTSAAAARLEAGFLKELDEFLCNVRHYYYQSMSIRDAIYDATNSAGKKLKGHGMEIYECLNSSDISLATDEYMNAGYHKYLKLFLSLARMVEENGDIEDEDGSVFLTSLMQLRVDVQEDKRYLEERRHRFAGLTYTAGLPIIAVPYIAIWGADTIPSLKSFYSGHTGLVIKTVLLAITYLGYSTILRLREGDRLDKKTHKISEHIASVYPVKRILDAVMNRNYNKTLRLSSILKRLCEKYTVRTFYAYRFCLAAVSVFVMSAVLSIGHYESRQIILTDVSDVSNLSTHADGKQISAMERVIPQYTSAILEEGFIPERERLYSLIIDEKGIRTPEIANAATDEILRRADEYGREYFGIEDVLLVLFFSFLCYLYPSVQLSFRRAMTDDKMQDEVMQYQSLIHMLKKVPGASAMSILEEMEIFSEIFRPSLQQCINEYNIDDQAAFERLYLTENYPGFRRIVDCFMLVDEMGVVDAFEEISSEIVNFKENRRLERKILLDSEGMLGTLIAVIPGGLIIFGYLLCPFLIRSVQIFNSYQGQLAQLTE